MVPAPENAGLLCEFLAARDVSCPNCRYNLRGLKTTSCPECGDPLKLGLSARAPKLTYAVSAAAPPGGGLLLTGLIAAGEADFNWQHHQEVNWPIVLPATLGAAAYAAVTVLFWHFRGRLMRLPTRRLRWMCWASWLHALAAFALILWL